eukprot:Rhum_TRINITY_DN4438_c0_g1::Rhum_TRINITY_DN4438_c0_g1_i1::g.14256::m.14256
MMHPGTKPKRRDGTRRCALIVVLLLAFALLSALNYRVLWSPLRGASTGPDGWEKAPLVTADGRPVRADDLEAWKQPGVTFFTILDDKRYFWCDTLASAWHNKITMNVWGWGHKGFKGWLDTWLKIPLAIEFSEGLDDEALMGFVDGADTLFQKGIPDILETYHGLIRTGGNVDAAEAAAAGGTEAGDEAVTPAAYDFVMSTEINCAVQSLRGHGCNNTRFPLTPWGRRYLNSGLYLGNAARLRSFLRFVEQYYLPRYRKGTVQRNDQSVIGLAYHEGWSRNFTLDARTTLFQSVRMAEDQYCQEGETAEKRAAKLPVPDAGTGLLKNCLTQGVPAIFHFNGKAKPFLGRWIKKYWWYGRKIPSNAVVFVNKKPVALRKICPKLKFE